MQKAGHLFCFTLASRPGPIRFNPAQWACLALHFFFTTVAIAPLSSLLSILRRGRQGFPYSSDPLRVLRRHIQFFSTIPSFLPHEVPSALYRSNCYLFPSQTDLSRRIAGPRDPTRCLPLLRPSSTSLLGAGIFTGDNNPNQQNGFTRLFRRCGAAQSPADAV